MKVGDYVIINWGHPDWDGLGKVVEPRYSQSILLTLNHRSVLCYASGQVGSFPLGSLRLPSTLEVLEWKLTGSIAEPGGAP